MVTSSNTVSPHTAAHESVMGALAAKLDDLTAIVPRESKIVYLDYPVHFNVGDLLINLGAEHFFARMRYRVEARFSIYDLCHVQPDQVPPAVLKDWVMRYLDALSGDTIVVLHGGGNFGDLYPTHQILRESVVALCPRHRVVVLPQSIHFGNSAAAERSFAIFATHPDFHLFVRDAESLEAANEYIRGRSRLLPDMAHDLWGSLVTRELAIASGPLEWRRLDMEADPRQGLQAVEGQRDWKDLIQPSDELLLKVLRRSMGWGLDPSKRLLCTTWYRERDRLIGRATALFGEHSSVRTDRLHGVILASLLSLPVRYRDNTYGKVSRYVNAWMAASPLIQRDIPLVDSNTSRLGLADA